MKIRQGFVSNSSSGSFILHWRMKTFGDPITTERAVGEVLGVFFKVANEKVIDEIDWENTRNPEVKEKLLEEVVKNTVINKDGTFTSTFWTNMFNSAEDFGETATSLVMGIVVNENDKFEIIDKKIEMDY